MKKGKLKIALAVLLLMTVMSFSGKTVKAETGYTDVFNDSLIKVYERAENYIVVNYQEVNYTDEFLQNTENFYKTKNKKAVLDYMIEHELMVRHVNYISTYDTTSRYSYEYYLPIGEALFSTEINFTVSGNATCYDNGIVYKNSEPRLALSYSTFPTAFTNTTIRATRDGTRLNWYVSFKPMWTTPMGLVHYGSQVSKSGSFIPIYGDYVYYDHS